MMTQFSVLSIVVAMTTGGIIERDHLTVQQ